MVYYRLGLCYLAKNNLKDALNMFEETIKLNRANYDAYYYKGICQRYLKYYEDAIITFNFFLVCFIKNKSITDEQIANVYYNKGRCLLSLGRYDEAIQMFTNYLKKNKNSYEVYFKRAVCYYNVHKYKKAVYDLSYLIQELSKEKNKQEKDNNIINEENKKNKNKEEDNDEELWAEIYFLRSKAYINMNKIESGLNDLNKFFDLIEKEKNKIKENLVKHGDKNYDIEKILYQKYDISDAHFKRGFCYYNLLDYITALKEFENAIKLDPNYTVVYSYIKTCKNKINKSKPENKKEKEKEKEEIEKEKNEIQ
jgi:tetratricopeptide (TPR) repeat protein